MPTDIWQTLYAQATSLGLSPTTLACVTIALTALVLALLQKPKASGTGPVKANVGSEGPIESGSATLVDVNKNREDGVWTPIKFTYPPIEPCPQKLADVKPIPYRPFRYGPYHVTMGLRSMVWNDWIELDRDHGYYHKVKAHRLKTRVGSRSPVRVVSDKANPVVDGGAVAAVEVAHELAEYLSRRYPSDFTVVRHPTRVSSVDDKEAFCDWGWEDLPPVKTITMTSLGVSYEIPLHVKDGERAPERALGIAGLLVQDDLILMMEGRDGKYYFQAGSVSLPGFWRMQDKIGMPLEEIHISGHVPQYKEKLEASLERFFRRLPMDKPMVRNNYFFQEVPVREEGMVDPEELGWAKSMVGEEDEYLSMGGHRTLATGGTVAVDVGRLRMRSERQTVRRLGRSGAVVFTVRTYLTPIEELAAEEGVAERLASALRSWPRDVGEYKGQFRGQWYSAIVEYMDDATNSTKQG